MDEAYVCGQLRKRFDKVGFALLIYYGIMTAAVTIAMLIQMIPLMLDVPQMSEEALMDTLMGNGWGYIVAIAAGCVILLLWKKKEFCFRTIWQRNNRMRVGAFFSLLSVFLSVQMLFQLHALLAEWIVNLFGMSVLESVEAASGVGDTFSMFLYACILAPIFEEVLFRGLLLRMLEPYGKKFAIFATAFLFGIFHANIVQSPFAFAVGLVLGYVAVEYSMIWAIVLHMINNFVLGDLFPRVMEHFDPGIVNLVFWCIIGGFTLAAVIICLIRRKEIKAYLMEKKIHPWCMKSFFTSPGVLVFSILMLGNIALTMLTQLLPA